MIQEHEKTPFVSIKVASELLGVPRSWLLAEVKAGRISHVMAGKTRLLHFESVRGELLSRMEQRPAEQPAIIEAK